MLKEEWMVVFLLFLPLTAASLTISEVMYAPTADYGGSSNEWIELYNNNGENYSTTSCLLDGAAIGNLSIGPYRYLVIAKVFTTFTNFYPNVTAIDGNL